MLVLGFELLAEDVLRVICILCMSLLTIYRRELSSNRAYHPNEDDENETLLDNSDVMQINVSDSNNDSSASLNDNDTPTMGLRRRKSSSALPSMTDSSPHNREIQQHINHPINNNINEDPTEVLLESAGLVLSGGPFLAMAIAIFDHLVLTTIVSFTSCASYVFYTITTWKNSSTSTTVKRIIPPSPSLQVSEEEALEQLLPESRHDKNSRSHNTAMKQQQNQQHLYSVAWNAATEYFHDITSKLLEGQSDSSSSVSSKAYPNTKESSYPRSKSMGNLQQNLSDEHSRALFHEMLAMQNSGSMDITLLPSDAQIVIFSYLPPKDVLAFTCTNRAGRSLLDDGEALIATTSTDHDYNDDGGEEEGDDDAYHYHGKNSQTPLLIWKALFHRDFSWVLTDWDIGKEAVVRSMSNYEVDVDAAQQESHRPKAGRVFHHLASTIIDPEQVKNNHPSIDITSMISQAGYIHPTSSMKEFYFTFKETWLNYTIAGCNSTEKCYIGLHGHVFNITNFVEDHPGSTETLLLQAGRDATIFFESMGHSLVARKLALSMCEVVNGQCVRYEWEGREAKNDLRAESLGPCSLIKPCDSSIAMKRNIPGFLIPKKRSRPRFQGGLHRIRERIRMEEGLQLATAATWANETLGQNGLFGGVQVYHDPFRGWRWWYTDRDFDVVYTKPLS